MYGSSHHSNPFPHHSHTTTVVRSCTEFSHERSHSNSHSHSSSSVVSKLLIQPAHLKTNSISRWPSPNARNPGVTLLHASNHVSVLPVRTIPAGKLKQLIASPHLPSSHHHHHHHTEAISHHSSPSQLGTGTTSSTSTGTMSMPSPVSYSPLHHRPQSSSSPNPQQQQHQNRPLRIAQPPPFASSSNATTSFPSCSSSSTSSTHHNHHPQQQHYLPNSISVPTLHAHKNSTSSMQHFPRSSASVSTLGERYGRMSYEELFELARNQQQQIETNEAELDERRKAVALFGVARRTAGSETEQQQNAKMLMANLRAQIELDEQELAQLGHSQKESRHLREHNHGQNRELHQLEAEYAQYEQQLHGSVQKVDSLRTQLETMYQRRASATDTGISSKQKQHINAFTGTAANGKINEHRPKASVSPFKSENIILDRNEPDNSPAKKHPIMTRPTPHQIHSSDENSPMLPSSSIQTVQWRRDYHPAIASADLYSNSSNGSLFPPAVDKISLRRNSINSAKRSSLLSEGSGDEHIMALLLAEQRRGKTHVSFGRSWDGQLNGGGGAGGSLVANAKANLGFSNDFERNNKRKEAKKTTENPIAITKVFNSAREDSSTGGGGGKVKGLVQQHQQNYLPPPHKTQPEKSSSSTSAVKSQASPVKKMMPPSERSFDEFNKMFDQQNMTIETKMNEEHSFKEKQQKEVKNGEEEKASTTNEEQKNDHQMEHPEEKMTNRISEIEETPEEEEEKEEDVERQMEEKKEEEMKEEKMTNFKSSEEEKEEKPKPEEAEEEEEEEESESEDDDEDEVEDASTIKMLENIHLDTATPIEGIGFDPQVLDRQVVDNNDDQHQKNSPTNSSSSSGSDEIQFDKSWHYQRPLGVEGILRRPANFDKIRQEKDQRRVKFPEVVLFLDVAYEGQYDELVELASNIENLSVANSEGITALHYAICANSEDIARFLLDNGANVNALDVDGWSPLHCAASCNNLPMLRLLIENGACPFATTISKSETAAQIFNESDDYAAGAEYMLLVEECMGEVNDRKVYAAYAYEAQNEDELNVEEGDELRVLRKSEKEEDDDEREGEELLTMEKDRDDEHDPHLWWLCEHTQPNKAGSTKGLVPRTYLALFPSWNHRNRYQVSFKLPQQLGHHNLEEEENGIGSSCASSEHSSSDDGHHQSTTMPEGNLNEEKQKQQRIGAIMSVQNNKPLGHQELSTYA